MVNTTGDASDANTSDGICQTATAGECTLRAAIQQANASAGANTIAFNIPGAGPHSIAVSTWLPNITGPVVIDGTTQPGFSGTPIIELNGSATTYNGVKAGLVVTGGNSTVKGLVINRFAVDGIRLEGGSNNTIQGNYIGTDISGLLDRGNAYDGIFIVSGSANNTIGGPAAADRNVIAGNDDEGIDVRSASNNIVSGNLIGIAADGVTPLGNTSDGVLISSSSTGNRISRNSIAANGGLGLNLEGGSENSFGVTANDGVTTSGQPNRLMDAPVFTTAALDGTTLRVSGYVGSAPNQATFASAHVEIFLAAPDTSGFGEGQTFLGTLTADANGNFTNDLPVTGVNIGDYITGTATDQNGNTSEFGANAVVTGLVALYDFAEGSGTVVNDSSGFGAPLNLSIADSTAVTWVPGGLAVNSDTIIASSSVASKIIGAATASNEITIEAWVQPASLSQPGPARLVTLSTGNFNRNFSLVQGDDGGGTPTDVYGCRLRTTATDNNGAPGMQTAAGGVSTSLQHVVYTRDTSGNTRLYVNNVLRAVGSVGGDLSNWSTSYRLALANELITMNRPWHGIYYAVAIYSRALNPTEVSQNFLAGPR